MISFIFVLVSFITFFFIYSVKKLNQEWPFKNIFRTETKTAVLLIDKHSSKIVAEVKKNKAFKVFATASLIGISCLLITMVMAALGLLLTILNIMSGADFLFKITEIVTLPLPICIIVNLILFDWWVMNHNIFASPLKYLKSAIISLNLFSICIAFLLSPFL